MGEAGLRVIPLLLLMILSLLGSIPQSSSLGSKGSSMQWSKTYGEQDFDCAFSVIQIGDGSYVLAGVTDSYDANMDDFSLVKIDSSGTQQWTKRYGGIGDDRAFSVVNTSDGGYALAGYTYSQGDVKGDFWLVKTDSAGTQQWNKTYGGSGEEEGRCMILTKDGGFAIVGWTNSSGAGGYDFWLVKTDSAGTQQWNKTYGGLDYEFAFSVVQTSDEGYAIAGNTYSYGAGSYDMWLVKTNSLGTQQWARRYGGPGYECAFSVVQTIDEGYALTGRTNSSGAGGYDFCLVKTDSAGTQEWTKTYGGIGEDDAWSMIQTNDGGYAIAGGTNSSGTGNLDSWLVKTDSTGSQMWNQTYGDTYDDHVNSIIQTIEGGYALVGVTDSSVTGNADFRLVKLSPEQVATPTFTPVAGNYYSAQNVSIQCATAGVIIRYTVDGSNPTSSSAVYSSPISVNANITIKAKAFRTGMTDSDTANATYTFGYQDPGINPFVLPLLAVFGSVGCVGAAMSVVLIRRRRSFRKPIMEPLKTTTQRTLSCNVCGSVSPETFEFCGKCGARLRDDETRIY